MSTSPDGGCAMARQSRSRPLHPLWELTLARLLEIWRSPGAVFWVFIFPVLLAVALGVAFQNRGQDSVRIAVTGTDRHEVRNALEGAPAVTVQLLDEADADRLLARGKVDLVVTTRGAAPEPREGPPAGTDGSDPSVPHLVLRFDPDRPDGPVLRMTVEDALQRGLGRSDPATIEVERVVQGGARYIDFLIPGLIGLNIMGSCMWGIGYAVVDQRKRKLLKRFAATPMNRSHYLLSFMLSRLFFLILEVALLLLFGWLVFGVTVRGSHAGVWLVAVLGAFAFSGMSVLVAARTEDTEVASGWMNFAMLPMWVLSGAFFDYSRFPDIFHPLIRLLPLTAINDALRALINHGESLFSLGIELAVLAAWGTLSFLLALRFFKWQ